MEAKRTDQGEYFICKDELNRFMLVRLIRRLTHHPLAADNLFSVLKGAIITSVAHRLTFGDGGQLQPVRP